MSEPRKVALFPDGQLGDVTAPDNVTFIPAASLRSEVSEPPRCICLPLPEPPSENCPVCAPSEVIETAPEGWCVRCRRYKHLPECERDTLAAENASLRADLETANRERGEAVAVIAEQADYWNAKLLAVEAQLETANKVVEAADDVLLILDTEPGKVQCFNTLREMLASYRSSPDSNTEKA